MTHSGDPWTTSGMKDKNKQHEAPFRAFLTELVQKPSEHAKFMNMLSLLEHMGSRKIMVSQMNRHETMDLDTLQHLAEEARHAFFFKRQAERMAGHALDGWVDENTMHRKPAMMYFGRLDAGISKRVTGDDPSDLDNQAYPWVSLIIELRACWIYHIYHEVLDKSDVTLSLKSLLAEEDKHLAEMFEMVGENTAFLQELCDYETALFGKLWSQFQSSMDIAEAA